MKRGLPLRFTTLAITLLAFAAGLSLRGSQQPEVTPARVVPMQNFEVEAGRSGKPAYLPRSWGRLVAVQSLGGGGHVLVLEAESGDLHFVRLAQRGDYLYLDTRDQGGVVTVLRRK